MDTATSLRLTRIAVARAWLFGIGVDHRKAIDDTIDYFGTGRPGVDRDPCGESLLAETETTER